MTLNLGLRFDHYDGLTTATLVQPRLGVSYAVTKSGTVLRASYGRTMETPYNENLLLSAGYGLNGLFGDSQAVPPGRRNQVEVGVQQGIRPLARRRLRVLQQAHGQRLRLRRAVQHADCVPRRLGSFADRRLHRSNQPRRARTDSAPSSSWRTRTPSIRRLASAAFSSNSRTGDFRIDHDQKFNATTNVQYVFEKRIGAWAALSWRYDSGLVAGAVGSLEDALALTGDQQAAIGFFCGSHSRHARCRTHERRLHEFELRCDAVEDSRGRNGRRRDEPAANRAATPVRSRIGVDNLLHTDRAKLRVRFSVINLTNKEALYNFLSTFSGTHFVTPRAYQVQLGVTF